MKKIFLISNSYKNTDYLIDSLPICDKDAVCLFNHASPKKIERIKKHNNKFLFCSHHGKGNNDGYHGLSLATKNEYFKEYTKIVLVKPSIKDVINKKFQDKNQNIEYYTHNKIQNDIQCNNILIFKNYPKNRHMTSGMIAIIYFMAKQYDINLVNFTAELSYNNKNFKRNCHFHGYHFEKTILDYMKHNDLANFFYS